MGKCTLRFTLNMALVRAEASETHLAYDSKVGDGTKEACPGSWRCCSSYVGFMGSEDGQCSNLGGADNRQTDDPSVQSRARRTGASF